ncbi:hypothetical protein B0H11DRAFT_1935101 [Mycena galericulata]|nr:hypothetical protein B0H11DRAFT_1935101 [Mycena galericulata]
MSTEGGNGWGGPSTTGPLLSSPVEGWVLDVERCFVEHSTPSAAKSAGSELYTVGRWVDYFNASLSHHGTLIEWNIRRSTLTLLGPATIKYTPPTGQARETVRDGEIIDCTLHFASEKKKLLEKRGTARPRVERGSPTYSCVITRYPEGVGVGIHHRASVFLLKYGPAPNRTGFPCCIPLTSCNRRRSGWASHNSSQCHTTRPGSNGVLLQKWGLNVEHAGVDIHHQASCLSLCNLNGLPTFSSGG